MPDISPDSKYHVEFFAAVTSHPLIYSRFFPFHRVCPFPAGLIVTLYPAGVQSVIERAYG